MMDKEQDVWKPQPEELETAAAFFRHFLASFVAEKWLLVAQRMTKIEDTT